jgi:hypothetical protein
MYESAASAMHANSSMGHFPFTELNLTLSPPYPREEGEGSPTIYRNVFLIKQTSFPEESLRPENKSILRRDFPLREVSLPHE